jgi:D-alanine-D-alanine ligase
MKGLSLSTKMPVVLLSNMDPSWTEEERTEVSRLVDRLVAAIENSGRRAGVEMLSDDNLAELMGRYDPCSHIVFNWCEGIPGIDHSEHLAALWLEELGFTYTGADARTLEISQDKHLVKKILERSGVPVPRWRIYTRPEAAGWDCFPAIVKAAREHCSEGITPQSVVTTPEELRDRIMFIVDSYRQPAMVEDFIDGREFHVSMWGNGAVDMLPPAEMDFSEFKDLHDRLCTHDSKCVPGSLHYEKIRTLLPAPLDDVQTLELERVCAAAYSAVGCRDYGRLDVRVRGGVFYVLDVNPNADISMDASLACAAELAGYPYHLMADTIVGLAQARHPGMRLSRRGGLT